MRAKWLVWLDLDLFRYRTLIAKLKNSQPDFDIASNFGNMLDVSYWDFDRGRTPTLIMAFGGVGVFPILKLLCRCGE